MSEISTPISPTQHVSVMTDEVLSYLQVKDGGRFLDCTFGGGGHTAAMLAAHPNSTVVALDRDAVAIARGRDRFAGQEDRLTLQRHRFSEAASLNLGTFTGVLADLGLSTDQLMGGRGFSFRDSETLDMRMDEDEEATAATLLNEGSPRELISVFRRGGVGREAHQLVNTLIQARPLVSALQLAEVVARALGSNPRSFKGSGKNHTKKSAHPATVVFQALRIAVNKEFEELHSLLTALPALVDARGRVAVISFHSLEDQEVARIMRGWEQGDTTPPNWRGRIKESVAPRRGTLLTRKAARPSPEEVLGNPSARSALLRVFSFT